MKTIVLLASLTFAASVAADVKPAEKIKATPQGLSTSTHSIIDSDRDGVALEFDQCRSTPYGIPVDEKGCSVCPEGTLDSAEGCFVENGETLVYPINVKFDTDSSEIEEAYLSELQITSQLMIEHGITNIVIAGHTDDQGSNEYNDKLAHDRALAVANALTRYGVPAEVLVTEGHGELKPIADNTSDEGRLQNRRVTAELRVNVNDKRYVIKK